MASIRSAGKKAAKRVRKNQTKKNTPDMVMVEGSMTPPNQNSVSCYGDWGGVSNPQTNGIKLKKKK